MCVISMLLLSHKNQCVIFFVIWMPKYKNTNFIVLKEACQLILSLFDEHFLPSCTT